MQTRCLFCGNSINLVFVHGHYQCPVCKTNALPCCDGDNCNNSFITQSNTGEEKEENSQSNAAENLSHLNKQQNIW